MTFGRPWDAGEAQPDHPWVDVDGAAGTYNGYPSANGVMGFGPDAVIVDGDWLKEQEDALDAARAEVAELRNEVAEKNYLHHEWMTEKDSYLISANEQRDEARAEVAVLSESLAAANADAVAEHHRAEALAAQTAELREAVAMRVNDVLRVLNDANVSSHTQRINAADDLLRLPIRGLSTAGKDS